MRRERWGRGRREGLSETGEEGFLLLGALIAIFLVLLVLSLAAPTMARQLRRDREVEAVHRGDQYVRAIQLYYGKFKHYPGSVDQLEKSNNVRFLRQKYVDPMTGKADWRLIHVGEQKTTVKGFFGQPLAGIAAPGLGSASSLSSGTGTVAGSSGSAAAGSGFGGTSGTGASGTGTLGTGTLGSSSSGAGAGAASGGTVDSSAGGSGAGSSGSSGIGSQSATSFTGTGAPIVGVGSSATGDSIVVLNEQTTHPTWEFIYDPRIEQMKAKVNLLGGGMANSGPSGLAGSSSLSSPSSGSSPSPGSTSATPAPATPQ